MKKNLKQIFSQFKLFKSKEQKMLEQEREIATHYANMQKEIDASNSEIKLEMMRKLVAKAREMNMEDNIDGEND